MWLYTSVDQPQKRNFSVNKCILGWKPKTGKTDFRSNFKFWVGDALKIFGLHPTNIYITLWNSRLFTYGINSSEGVSRLRFFIWVLGEQQWKHSILLIFDRRLWSLSPPKTTMKNFMNGHFKSEWTNIVLCCFFLKVKIWKFSRIMVMKFSPELLITVI